MNLDKLLAIARAFPATWTRSETYEDWAEVFHPRLIEKMIAEIAASRRVDESASSTALDWLKKAREALDAELETV